MNRAKRFIAICLSLLIIPALCSYRIPEKRIQANGIGLNFPEENRDDIRKSVINSDKTAENETTKATTIATVSTTKSTTSTKTAEATTTTAVTGADEFVWDGPKLNPIDGVVHADESPSGYKETYYNMWMFGCLDLMGLNRDGYGERADGVKTYNGYVMVASPDLEAYPKGSKIPTSLGMGIVVDSCPAGNLDIAVTWK